MSRAGGGAAIAVTECFLRECGFRVGRNDLPISEGCLPGGTGGSRERSRLEIQSSGFKNHRHG